MVNLDNEMSRLRDYVLQESKKDHLYQWQEYNNYASLRKAGQALENVAKELHAAAVKAEGVRPSESIIV